MLDLVKKCTLFFSVLVVSLAAFKEMQRKRIKNMEMATDMMFCNGDWHVKI